MTAYWIDGPAGCPVAAPFDLWRKNYFVANGTPPDDTQKMYPALTATTVTDVAVATVRDGATLDDVLRTFAGQGPDEQLSAAHRYFSRWIEHAPFMPDSWQDVPLRPARTSPEPLDEFMKNWRAVNPHFGGTA